MENQITRLRFNCPKQWDSMTPTEGGRFCSDCKKSVTDFTKIPLPQHKDFIPNGTQDICGSFMAYDLHKPFGNWKDKIITLYQHHRLSTKASRHLTLFMLTIILAITGCVRRYTGEIVRPNGDTCMKNHQHHSHQNTRTLSPQPGSK